MSWETTLYDSNNEWPASADTTPGAAGSSTGTGGTLIDAQGGRGRLVSHIFNLTGEGSGEFARDHIALPQAAPNLVKNLRIIADIPANGLSNGAVAGLISRYQGAGSGSGYIHGWNAFGGGALEEYQMLGGNPGGAPMAASAGIAYDPTKTYQLLADTISLSATVTRVALTLYDTTGGSSVSLGTITADDPNPSALRNASSAGLAIWSNPATVGPVAKFSRLRILTDAAALTAPALTFGAISSTSIAVIAAPNGGTTPYTGIQGQRAPDNGSNAPGVWANVGPNNSATTMSHTGLTANTKYWFRYTVTDSAGATATSVPVSQTTSAAAGAQVLITDPNVFFSPYNWRKSGTAYAEATSVGAYIRKKFTGTSTVVGLDVAPLNGYAAANYPVVAVGVDGGPLTYLILTSGQATITITGLTNAVHTFFLIWTGNYVFGDSWTATNVLRITGFTLDAGATTAAPTLKSKRMIAFGDSITKAEVCKSPYPLVRDSQYTDAYSSYVFYIAEYLDAEVGIVAYGGLGWEQTSAGNVPRFDQSWTFYSQGQSRLVGGLLSPAPDYATCNHGANGSVSAATVQAWQAAFRAAAGPNCKLFQIIPFGGFNRANITAGVQAYKTASGDVNVFLIDLGTAYQTGLSDINGTGSTAQAADGLHPNQRTQGVLGAASIASIEQAMASGGNTGNPVYPLPGQVLANISFGNNGASTGTLGLPTVAQVEAGVGFGGNSNEFIGTLATDGLALTTAEHDALMGLFGMTQLSGQSRQFSALALAQAPTSSSGSVAYDDLDINMSSLALVKANFQSSGREIVSVKIVGTGQHFPDALLTMPIRIVLGPTGSKTAPVPTSENSCIAKLRTESGDVYAECFLGDSLGSARFQQISPVGSANGTAYQVWLLFDGDQDQEEIWQSAGVCTVF